MIQSKNKIILNCFTCEEVVFKYSLVQHLNYKLNAFYIPFWKDFTVFDLHPLNHTPLFLSKKTHRYVNHLKENTLRIYSPWIMKTNKDCYFSLTAGSCLTINKENSKLNTTSNIHNYENYFNSYIDINIELTGKNKFELNFFFGQPFAYGVTFSNKKLVIKNHLISEKKYIEMRKEGEKNESKIEFTQLMDEYINECKTN